MVKLIKDAFFHFVFHEARFSRHYEDNKNYGYQNVTYKYLVPFLKCTALVITSITIALIFKAIEPVV